MAGASIAMEMGNIIEAPWTSTRRAVAEVVTAPAMLHTTKLMARARRWRGVGDR